MNTGYPSDHPTTTPAAIPIRDAAAHLGISENAVRKRIRRGTLDAHKVDGEWRVVVTGYPTATPETPPAATTGHPTAPPSDQAALIDQLRSENDFLRTELEARRESEREQRIIISQLVGRVEALTSGQDARQDAGETGEEVTGQNPQPASRRAWWKFWVR